MEIILEHKDAADWVYRGEGSANLVLAYTGSSSDFIGKVMRIQKAPKNGQYLKGQAAFSTHERLVWRDIIDHIPSPDKDIVGQLFVQHVMTPLLGSRHVDAGMRVLVTREFLESVEKNVNGQRPAWRVADGKVNPHRDYVLLLSDHSLFPHGNGEPCISVEIKPKCGFLPTSRFIAKDNFIKKKITRFRMHQALKLHQGEISKLSDYNPLDLFSGSKDRIHKAIKDLFATPQNNFRVFLNGSLIFGALGSSMASSNLVLEEAFEDALRSVFHKDDELRTTSFLQLVTESVHRSGILDRLLSVQKLDKYDIEGAIHAYYNIISEPCLVCRQLEEDQVLQKYSSLHSIPIDQSLKIVKDFLLAATAKDCSLMISFRPRDIGVSGSSCNGIYLESSSQTFEYKVNFIDLDLKPFKKMEGYYELDQKILGCFAKKILQSNG